MSGVLTYVAVFASPALVTLTLPLLTHAVLAAHRMTRLLVTHTSCPAVLAATHSAITHSMGAAVHLTHLCWNREEERK